MPEPLDSKTAWSTTSWRGAESSTLAAGAAMSLPERLRWLEETARAVRSLRADATATERTAQARSQ